MRHVDEKNKINNNGDDDDDNGFKQVIGDDELFFSSKYYLSLLASKHRHFLLSQDGTQVKISELQGKVVGIYFSANWYPPCRQFNQLLIDAYEQLKSIDPGFEIVLVSSDEDSEAFDNYRASMPWLAVPFSDLETKKALNREFDIEDIPCLIILQPDCQEKGEVIRDGVGLIYRYGMQSFPFTKARLEQLEDEERKKQENQTLTNLLTTQDRDFVLGHPMPKQVPITSLIGKTIGLYFSADWCLPGAKFTPKLISIYQNIKQELIANNREDFEIVFVSRDNDQVSFDSYFHAMPWLTLPYGDPTVAHLIKHFDVQWIPSLVILGPDGKTVTPNGRNMINLYQENAYPFTKERVETLEKQMDEEAKNLPKSEYHVGHHHELTLVSQGTGGGPFICCACDEQGSGWVYQCVECGYEVHPKCMQPEKTGSVSRN